LAMTGARGLEDELLQCGGAGFVDGYAVLAELVAQVSGDHRLARALARKRKVHPTGWDGFIGPAALSKGRYNRPQVGQPKGVGPGRVCQGKPQRGRRSLRFTAAGPPW